MKSGTIVLLVASHLLAGGLGWLAMVSGRDERSVGESGPEVTESSGSTVADAVPTNPVFLATGADFQAAWDEDRGTGPGGPHGLFIDWCGVDPEGAILALCKVYPSSRAKSFLVNAAAYHGDAMAEALVAHWRELKYLEESKLMGMINHCLNLLAKEDPVRAGELLFELPSRLRADSYRWVLQGLSKENTTLLAEKLLARAPQVTESKERFRLWEGLADAVDRSDRETGLLDWLPRIEARDGFEAFAGTAAGRAAKFERWPDLMKATEGLSEEQQASLGRQVALRAAAFSSPGYMVPFLSACEEHGHWDWAEAMRQQREESKRKPADPPASLLDWAVSSDDADGRKIDLAVDLALQSNVEESLAWIEGREPGRERDRILVEAIDQLAGDADGHGALGDWLDLIQDPALRAAAQQRLQEE